MFSRTAESDICHPKVPKPHLFRTINLVVSFASICIEGSNVPDSNYAMIVTTYIITPAFGEKRLALKRT
jgi:hypothetical protein